MDIRNSLSALSLVALCATGPTWAPSSPATTVADVDASYFSGRPAQALTLCEDAIASGEESVELRWRAARAAIALGLVLPEGAEQRRLFDKALEHARRGKELAPEDVNARYWLAAAAASRANRDNPIYGARLVLEAYHEVTAILASDSNHAGAHHLLGEMHAELMRVPALVRFIGGQVLRVNIAVQANARDAERHLRRAAELEPDMVIYTADLATFYLKSGAREKATPYLSRLSDLPSRHPVDDAARAGVLAIAQR